MESGAASDVGELFAEHDARCDIDHRHAGDLADVRHRTRRARVYLDDVKIAAVDEVLYVDEPARAERKRKLCRGIDDGFLHPVGQVERRIHGDRIAAVHARALDVLHDSGDQHVLPVGNHIDLKLASGHVFIDQHGIFDAAGKYKLHITAHVAAVVRDHHILTADNV